MNYIFAPGCALLLYKPDLAEAAHEFLVSSLGEMEMLLTCCQHIPPIPEGTTVINVCPGCDRRYRTEYDSPRTISLWELVAESDTFPFPDYGSQPMTIIDACPTRDQDRIHDALRTLASKMNIELVEPDRTKRSATCCGDISYGKTPTRLVIEQMKSKADEMPLDNIIVYCISCIKAMFVGARHPRYMLDLLFAEDSLPQTFDPDEWHAELDAFVDSHAEYEIASR